MVFNFKWKFWVSVKLAVDNFFPVTFKCETQMFSLTSLFASYRWLEKGSCQLLVALRLAKLLRKSVSRFIDSHNMTLSLLPVSKTAQHGNKHNHLYPITAAWAYGLLLIFLSCAFKPVLNVFGKLYLKLYVFIVFQIMLSLLVFLDILIFYVYMYFENFHRVFRKS